MSTEANKAVARRLYEIFDRSEWAALDTLVAPNAVIHDPVLGVGGPEILRQRKPQSIPERCLLDR